MSKLVCGPFVKRDGEDGVSVVIPIRTQGDWRRTEEGHEAMDDAQTGISLAVRSGRLPKDAQFNWLNDDSAELVIPCASFPEACRQEQQFREVVQNVTHAAFAGARSY